MFANARRVSNLTRGKTRIGPDKLSFNTYAVEHNPLRRKFNAASEVK